MLGITSYFGPLYNTSPKDGTGGLAIYKDSHKHGYFDHSIENPAGGKKWTKQYTHVEDKNIVSSFERIELEVKAGSVVLMHSAVIHNGYLTTKKYFVRITITEQYNPLQKISYVGVDYNAILD